MSDADLVSAIQKFIAWEKELVEVTSEQPRDGADRLGTLLYGKDDPLKLLGGCQAKIFHDAAKEIATLRGLLRVVGDNSTVPALWRSKVKAALEGKP